MKIYTKFGDKGLTALFDGTRVPKDHLRIETYGTIDELNSLLGLAITHCVHPDLRTLLSRLQHQLFELGSDLATPPGSPNESKIRRINAAAIGTIEHEIDAATAQLPALQRFVLPGGSATAATLHVARTVCRRAERHLVSLLAQEASNRESSEQPSANHALIYLNRMSDLLFTLARLANKLDGLPDVEWNPAGGNK